MMIALMREIPFDAARLEDLGVGREQGFGARQVAALARLLILPQRRRRRLIIRGWLRVGGNRDDHRHSNPRLFVPSHPSSPFLFPGSLRPPLSFSPFFTTTPPPLFPLPLTY